MKSKHQLQSGFTLVELIVSMSIMVILVTVVAVGLNNSKVRSQRNVLLGSNNLVSDIHKLQSFSLSSRNVNLGNGNTNPAASYTATFNAGAISYTLTAEDNSQPANQETIFTTFLPPNTQISSIKVTSPTSGAPVGETQAAVNFSVPYGRISATYPLAAPNTVDELNDIVQLQVKSTIDTTCEYVTINGITGNITTNTVCP